MNTLGIFVAWSMGVFNEEILVVVLAVRDSISAIGIAAGVSREVRKLVQAGEFIYRS